MAANGQRIGRKVGESIGHSYKEPPLPKDDVDGDLEVWKTNDRLARHARKFQSHPDKAALLKRYEDMAEARGLLRYTCHVAAWVAMCPQSAANAYDERGLSPAMLLARLLRRIKRARMTPWLRGILRLVCVHVAHAGDSAAPSEAAHWRELQYALPLFAWSQHLEGTTAALPTEQRNEHEKTEYETDKFVHEKLGTLDETYDVGGRPCADTASNGKQLPLLNRACAHWDGMERVAREGRMDGLERRFEEAVSDIDGGVDAKALRFVLRGVCAALAPPRAKPVIGQESGFLDEVAVARLVATAALQRRAHKLLIKALNLWHQSFDDEQIRAILAQLRRLICHFEARAGSVEEACAGKAWTQLRALLDLPVLARKRSSPALLSSAEPASLAKPAVRMGRGTTKNKQRTDKWKSRGSKNFMDKGLLEILMKSAMRRLPECRGTYQDVADKIKADPDLWMIGKTKLDLRPHVEKGKLTQRLTWEHRVAIRMAKFFAKTGLTIGTKAVWCQRETCAE